MLAFGSLGPSTVYSAASVAHVSAPTGKFGDFLHFTKPRGLTRVFTVPCPITRVFTRGPTFTVKLASKCQIVYTSGVDAVLVASTWGARHKCWRVVPFRAGGAAGLNARGG